jgi:hypothetical protein
LLYSFKKIFLFFFVLIIVNLKSMENINSNLNLKISSNYKDSIRNPAFDCEALWSLKDACKATGASFKAKLVRDRESRSTSILQRLTIFSPGLATDPFCRIINPLATEIFPEMKGTHPLVYPGDFFVFDTPDQGFNTLASIKKASFGQNDAFRLIYTLKKLKDRGIQEIDIDTLCYGTLRVVHALGILNLPHEYSGALSILSNMGLENRIEREQILSMIRSITIHSPLKQVEDIFEKHVKSSLLTGGIICTSASLLPLLQKPIFNPAENYRRNICLFGLSMIAVGTFLSKPLAKGLCYFGLPLITSYNSATPNPYTMLKKLEHLKREYPQLSVLMTSHAIDFIVGNDIEEFFRSFPVEDNRKYLVVSSEKGHTRQTQEQINARHAFRKLYGSSYYNLDSLEKGLLILDAAQKGQTADLQTYIKNSTDKNMKIHNF